MRPQIQKTHALGQNFLVDQKAIQKIVSHFVQGLRQLPPEQKHARVFEIGPGQGALTKPILEILTIHGVQEFVLFERDSTLIPTLSQKFLKRQDLVPSVTIEEGDFLDSRWRELLPATVISNLPYSAGTRILLELTRQVGPQLPWMVLMFQKEVAERILAAPSTSDRGSLSVWIQNYWEVTRVLQLPPEAFRPAPKIDSTVLAFRARSQPLFQDTTADTPGAQAFEKLLSATFLHRRKMIRKNLASLDRGSEILALAKNVEGTLRAEALTQQQWEELWNAYRSIIPFDQRNT